MKSLIYWIPKKRPISLSVKVDSERSAHFGKVTNYQLEFKLSDEAKFDGYLEFEIILSRRFRRSAPEVIKGSAPFKKGEFGSVSSEPFHMTWIDYKGCTSCERKTGQDQILATKARIFNSKKELVHEVDFKSDNTP